MRLSSIKIGRNLLLAALVAVVVAVLSSLWFHSRSSKDAEPAPALLPADITASTEGFSGFHFDTTNGQTTFEIKAQANLGFKDSKNLFQKVEARVFGKGGERYDTISADRCEYDQASGEVLFLDNVLITLNQLDAEARREAGAVSGNRLTTIRMDRMKYSQSTGIADTDDLVDFRTKTVHGRSRGLTYDSKAQTLHLRSQVEIVAEAEAPDDRPLELWCDSLLYDKVGNRIDMSSHVVVKRDLDEMSADTMTAWLDSEDSHLQRIEARGNVHSASRDPRFQMVLDAQRVDYRFDQVGRWLTHVEAQGAVRARSLDPERRRDVSAQRMDIRFNPKSHEISDVHCRGNVEVILADTSPPPFKSPEGQRTRPGDRMLQAPEVTLTFDRNGGHPSRLDTQGPSRMVEVPSQSSNDRRELSAQAITVFFDPVSGRASKLDAHREVKVEIKPARGPIKTTQSAHLAAQMNPETGEIRTIRQYGEFRYQEAEQQALAEEGTYASDGQLVTLQGRPEVRDAKTRTTAELLQFYQAEGRLKAKGHVRTIFYNREPNSAAGVFSAGSPVYASSDEMDADTTQGVAHYRGRAKLWQEDQVVRARSIRLDRSERKLVAEGDVVSLLHLESEDHRVDEGTKRRPATISAQSMTYLEQKGTVTYQARVHMIGELGEMKSEKLEIFLELDDKGKRVMERMVALQQVRIAQPERTARSERAEYFRNEERVVLTGGPPQVVDSVRGSTTGARLTMHLDDGSISVESTTETRSMTQQRVTR
ncbi:MAG: LPS export ABC transporter periplasmic protein LptC [Acidobacteriota bacterium]